ncbi:hypothetical protein MKX01_028998 [Papaver californicum]|nr:hypothetical protein MKX01_028998 [Papaver californicum]
MLDLLNQLDGFEASNKIKGLMATNRIDILDPELLSPMSGASDAELKDVCTEAGMFALRERRVHVAQENFEMLVAKVRKKETDKNMSLRKVWK